MEIYVGDLLENESERLVFEKLVGYFSSSDAIILANVNLNGRQIDFIVATNALTLVIEAKGYTRPLRGMCNGPWSVLVASGEWKETSNLYLQTLGAKYALRDSMREFSHAEVYYPDAVLVFAPEIPRGSQLCPSDHKVEILGLPDLGYLLSKQRTNCWDIEQWKRFAEHHALKKVSTPAASFDPKISKAQTIISSYGNAFMRTYGFESVMVPVPCQSGDGEILSTDLVTLIANDQRSVILTGPSGCAKTLIARNAALRFCELGGVPLLLPCKDYSGRLRTLMDVEVKLLDVDGATHVVVASGLLQRKLLLILDGYNECTESQRAVLTRSAKAFCKKYDASIFITSQISLEQEHLLSPEKFAVSEPSLETKIQIANLVPGCTISNDTELLLRSISSGLEASIVGDLSGQVSSQCGRYALFDSFARKRLGIQSTKGVQALSLIAGYLSENFAVSLSQRELDRFAASHGIETSVLETLVHQRLLIHRGDRLSFPHELFLNAFAAESLTRSASGNADTILESLDNPAFADCQEFLVGTIENDILLDQVLSKLRKSKLVVSIVLGNCGNDAREWMNARIRFLLEEMRRECANVRYLLTQDGWEYVSFDPTSLTAWNPSEIAIFRAIPELLSNEILIEPLLEVVGELDHTMHNEWQRLLDDARKRKIPLRSGLFSISYVGGRNSSPAVTQACRSIGSSFYRDGDKEYSNLDQIILERIRSDNISPGQSYLLLSLSRAVGPASKSLPRLTIFGIRRFWESAPYHLKVELMQGAEWSAIRASTDEKVELIQLIESLPHTNNIGVSSSMIDALQRLGALDQAAEEHEASVAEHLNTILNSPETKEWCTVALHLYNSQFDHPYDSAYCQVVGELAEGDRKRFLMMAAKGATFADSTFFLSSLIIDLVALRHPPTGEILNFWIQIPAPDSFDPYHAVEAFVAAHVGIAILGTELPPRDPTNCPAGEALALCGDVIYWSSRNDISLNERRRMSCPAIESLSALSPVVAIEAIWQCDRMFANGIFESAYDSLKNTKRSIRENFPSDVCTISRSSLQAPSSASHGYFERQIGVETGHLKFAIEIIQDFGSSADLPLLRQYVSHNLFGEQAVRAIKVIRERS